ncbi:hypothetical protein IKE71_00920, partial [Candidatus Saccharibacteria bacterium]|nr:hypothetical protein [Candidatus Saccharibacteria bacterium]
IVGNPNHGYFISMGEIRDVWVKQQWEFGPLGFPQSDILTNEQGITYQKYEGGTIYSSGSKSWYE